VHNAHLPASIRFFQFKMGDKDGMAVTAGLAIGIAFVILFASFGGQEASIPSVYQGLYMAEADGGRVAIKPINIEEESCSGCIFLKFWDAETYVEETERSAVNAKFLVNNVTLQKGSYAEVPLLLKHMGGDSSERYVSIRVLPPTGYTLYPKSVAESTTVEERLEAAKTATMLRGGVDLARFVVASDPVNIQVGSQQTVNVRFVVPEDTPAEVNSAFVPILLEATTQSSASHDSVFLESTGMDLIIVHS
jgi:hypothetical protein